MPVGLQIEHQKSGPSTRCDQTSLSQVAENGCLLSRHCLLPIPLKRRECPQDYMVERPAKAGRPGFVSRSRASGIAQKLVLLPIVALLLWNFMANAGETTLATSGFEFRPTSRKAG